MMISLPPIIVTENYCKDYAWRFHRRNTNVRPIYRLRELGFYHRVFDMIDERQLTKGELRSLCVLLFGQANFDGVPDPAVDWKGFFKEVEKILGKEKSYWNPISKKVTPLLDLKQLNKAYGDKKDCSIM